jgi:hypothetical protein
MNLARETHPIKASMSDHFDGNRFFNPTLPKGSTPSRRSVIKMLLEPRSRWPAWVENKGAPQPNEMLGTDEVALILQSRDFSDSNAQHHHSD